MIIQTSPFLRLLCALANKFAATQTKSAVADYGRDLDGGFEAFTVFFQEVLQI